LIFFPVPGETTQSPDFSFISTPCLVDTAFSFLKVIEFLNFSEYKSNRYGKNLMALSDRINFSRQVTIWPVPLSDRKPLS